MFYIYLEAGDQGPVVHVGPQSPTTIHNRAPRLPQDRGVILVRGPWYETPSSPRIPFDVNQSMTFPGWS